MNLANLGSIWEKWWTPNAPKFVRLLQAAVFLAAGIAVFGPINAHFRGVARDSVYGPAYYEAKERKEAVLSAESFNELRKKSLQLAAWNSRVGSEFLSLKRETDSDAFRFRKAKTDLEAVLSESAEPGADRGYAVFRMRKAAEDLPVKAFQKGSVTPESLEAWWIAAFALAACLSSGIVSLLGSWATHAPRSIALVRLSASALGAAIGGGIAGWIMMPMLLGPLG